MVSGMSTEEEKEGTIDEEVSEEREVEETSEAVSYTHLTLPTIYSV